MAGNNISLKRSPVLKPHGPNKWPLLVTVVVVTLFLGLFFGAQGVNSLTKEATYCASCHVMENAYLTWNRSAHREVADCNSCHVDQSNYVAKTLSKVKAGIKDSYVYYSGNIPVKIRLNSDPALIQQNCLRCHQDLTRNLKMDPDRNCFDCHRFTPHGNFR